jgi:hypothetical protein
MGLKIISTGEGKARMTRNKRRGVRLKVYVDPSYSSSFCFCAKCCIWDMWCVDACQEYEKVTGTTKYWFEIDEDSKD